MEVKRLLALPQRFEGVGGCCIRFYRLLESFLGLLVQVRLEQLYSVCNLSKPFPPKQFVHTKECGFRVFAMLDGC
jgi:hypothetical protein